MSLTARLPSSSPCLRTLASYSRSTPQKRVNQRRHHATMTELPADLPLAGIRVLELGQLIAGPFAGQLLGFIHPLLPIYCR
jgi:hypothetical protein